MIKSIINYIKVKSIKGLKIKKISTNEFEFYINENTKIEEIELFINSFPNGFQLSFFDYYHPKVSDPGAYVWAQKFNKKFIFQLSNHGWSSKWDEINSHELVAYIDKNKKFTSDYFRINPILYFGKIDNQ